MAEVNIDVAKESTGQQILSAGAKEATSQEILSAGAKEATSQQILSTLANSGGGSSFPNYSTILAGQTSTSPSPRTTITGKGRLVVSYFTQGTTGLYAEIDGVEQPVIIFGYGAGMELYFNQSVRFYSAKSSYYVAQVE